MLSNLVVTFYEIEDEDKDGEEDEYEGENEEEGEREEESEEANGEEENRCKRFAKFDFVRSILLFGRPCSPPPGPHLGAQGVRSGISGLPRAPLGRAPNPKGPPGEALCAARSRSRGPRSDF